MSCEYCHDTGWLLYKKEAPSPPYNQGMELEYAKECVCRVSQRYSQNKQGKEY
jgi:hypothetical protein